jgi:hypothetical protein
VETASFWLSPRWVVAVFSLLTVAAVAVSAFVLVLLIAVMAAASVAGLAAAATPSSISFCVLREYADSIKTYQRICQSILFQMENTPKVFQRSRRI